MPSSSLSVLLFSVFFYGTSSKVLALLPGLPVQTSTLDEVFNAQGWSPRPTDNPSLPANIFARHPNFPGDAQKVLVAPDNTCGYFNGLQGAPFSCSPSFKCVFFSATGTYYGRVACCTSGVDCNIRTACVASKDLSACGNGCQLDAYTRKCTNSARPRCGQVYFTSPYIADYVCIDTALGSLLPAVTTYQNQPQRVFTTLDKSDLWPVSTSSTSSQSSSPTSDDDTNPPSSTPSNHSTPGGAIAGGVIGGIALVAIVGLGAYVLLRRRKLQKVGPVGYPQDPVVPYGGRIEMDTGQSYKNPSSPGYGKNQFYDPPEPQEMYVEPLKPQELGSTERVSGLATGSYTQVPTEEWGGHHHQGAGPRR